MSNDGTLRLNRSIAAGLMLAAIRCQVVRAQTDDWRAAKAVLLSANAKSPGACDWAAALNPVAAPSQPVNVPRRPPVAVLIENPDQTPGAPPYALTDQSGTV